MLHLAKMVGVFLFLPAPSVDVSWSWPEASCVYGVGLSGISHYSGPRTQLRWLSSWPVNFNLICLSDQFPPTIPHSHPGQHFSDPSHHGFWLPCLFLLSGDSLMFCGLNCNTLQKSDTVITHSSGYPLCRSSKWGSLLLPPSRWTIPTLKLSCGNWFSY